MAHFVKTGASTFRPWHFAETRDVWETLTGNESGETVRRMAGLRRMRKAPLFVNGYTEALSRAYGIVYEDTGTPVGDEAHGHVTVGEDFEIFQPEEMFDFTDALREVDSQVKYVSAGALKGGRILWTLADAGSLLSLKRPNGTVREHRKHLFIYNPCDGTGKLTVMFTDTDVCCWNTASFALSEKTATRWSTKHTRFMRDRLGSAAEALQIAPLAFAEQAEAWQLLNGLDMSTLYGQRTNAGGMLVFASQLATGIDDAGLAVERVQKAKETEGRSEAILRRKVDDLLGLFTYGINACGVDAVDALSAVTEYIDHQKSRSAKWRDRAAGLGVGMDSAFLGTGAETKRRAVRLLLTRSGKVVAQ